VQVWRRRAELPGRVACVTFTGPAALGRFERGLGLEGLGYFCDPDRSAYQALGFGRASVARVWLHPRVWARYLRLLRAGWRAARLDQDTLQLGGDVVLGPDGRVAWIYRSSGPEDRPGADAVIAAARAAAASTF
jgi:AhpC/TSA antioxidant enzyme